MNSATLIVLLAVNLWGIVSSFGVLHKMKHHVGMRYNVTGSIKVMRLIMYLTFACVVFALWNRHVHFVL
jgi:hypothetical protein